MYFLRILGDTMPSAHAHRYIVVLLSKHSQWVHCATLPLLYQVKLDFHHLALHCARFQRSATMKNSQTFSKSRRALNWLRFSKQQRKCHFQTSLNSSSCSFLEPSTADVTSSAVSCKNKRSTVKSWCSASTTLLVNKFKLQSLNWCKRLTKCLSKTSQKQTLQVTRLHVTMLSLRPAGPNKVH